MLLDGKNAVIYGGGGSIGGAVTRAFAREGARVFLPDARGRPSKPSPRRSGRRAVRPRPRSSMRSTRSPWTGTLARSRPRAVSISRST